MKWIWELNRLQHLPLLAQAWLVTDDDRYADAALDDLDSWMSANPPGHGDRLARCVRGRHPSRQRRGDRRRTGRRPRR